jgi:hypothetical protein
VLIDHNQDDIARGWFAKFEAAATQGDTGQLVALFHPDRSYLRDMLIFTWDYRTLDGQDAIRSYLDKGSALKKAQIAALKIEGDALFIPAAPGKCSCTSGISRGIVDK